MGERSCHAAFVMTLPFPLRFEGCWQVILKRAHFRSALSMQLELDLYHGGNNVRHVRHLPRAPCESPFAALDQIRHTTPPTDVLYSPNDAAAEQIEWVHSFHLSDNNVNLTYNDRFTMSWPADLLRGELLHVSSLWKAFARQFADSMNRATNGFFLVRGGLYVFIDDGWSLRAVYYGPKGTLAKDDEGTWKPHLNTQSQGYGPKYEGWNGRDQSMGTQQRWFHRSDFNPFAVDESTQRLHVGRPGGTSGPRMYVWFVISKTLVALLHLERVLPVPEAAVKDRDAGGPWLHVVPVVGNAKRVMVMWLIPAYQSHSDFLSR